MAEQYTGPNQTATEAAATRAAPREAADTAQDKQRGALRDAITGRTGSR